MNSRDIIKKTRDDYNKIAPHFGQTRHRLWNELLEFAPLVHEGQNILDWGCGNGRLILLFKDKKIKYFGVDQSAELIKIAKRQHAEELKEGWVKFFSTANKDKIFESDFFDIVFMIASFHHLPDEKMRLKILKKIHKEMKPGGKIILANWNLKGDWIIKKKQLEEIAPNDYFITWKNPAGVPQAQMYYHHFEPEKLEALLKKAGFTVEKNEYDEQKRNLITLAIKK